MSRLEESLLLPQPDPAALWRKLWSIAVALALSWVTLALAVAEAGGWRCFLLTSSILFFSSAVSSESVEPPPITSKAVARESVEISLAKMRVSLAINKPFRRLIRQEFLLSAVRLRPVKKCWSSLMIF